MNSVFNFLLRGIGSSVKLGKNGPRLKSSGSNVEFRLPDDTGLTNLKVASPKDPEDAVNLDWIRKEVLANWNTPVQSLLELKSIPASERKDKQIREVENELTLYQFDADSLLPVPDTLDSSRVILPDDITASFPGRWLKTKARTSLHSELIGLSLNDHPQYQLRSEKNSSNGYAGVSENFGIELVSSQGNKSVLRSVATSIRDYILPDKSGELALNSEFVGATFQSNGVKGLVPGPATGDREKFLSGDGSWRTNYGSLKNSSVKTADYTAIKYERVLCDVSGGGFSISLPLNPNDNEVVGILDISNFAGTNPITILRNGQKIEDLQEDWQLDLDGGSWELCYSIEKTSWYFLSSKSYNNVAPSSGFVTNSPSFLETSLAPSANAVKQYIEQIQITIFQMISNVGVFLFGSGFAPSGTAIKNAYFEGTTNSSGLCQVDTGLGANILSCFAFVSDGSNAWYSLPTSGVTATSKYDNQGFVSVQFSGSSIFQNRNVRFRVEYK
ncbi:hypothetical protein FH581_023505 (plasmid) [Leptospira weilii]|uniref:hypothetical protein n=1 Tax=Leptospira weilii TaxID=28184 RepID=UPI00201B7F0B|nr:hypothetical protein [Leptospira weilii]UPY81138.1 hypothetical protein FH581_023070 [Leptospira weilii]UPY81217.1 hypothetical protein FH581_023505 [Leptospira weilii]